MSITIAQATDLHLDDFMAKGTGIDSRRKALKILEAIEEQGINALVLTGDLGLPGSQSWLLDAIAAHNLSPLFVLGNHDKLADFRSLAEVSDFIKPDGLYYSQIMGEVSCIFLDSSQGQIDGEQLSWLKSRIDEEVSDVVVFTHYPVLDCGQTCMDRLYPLKSRDRLLEVFEKSSRRVSIFCGHYHTTHEQSLGSISQYVTPSTLLQIRQHSDGVEIESKDFGYRLIRFSADEINTEVVLFNP